MNGLIRWLGVAFVEYRTPEKKIILFDPWTKDSGSPTCPLHSNEFEKADLILVSHDHFDHISSAPLLCHRTGALLGGPDETMKRLLREDALESNQILNDGSGYIAGGGAELDWIEIVATPAVHTSDTSAPIGTIILPKSGITIYHTGDTGIFSDMVLYSELYPIDLLILPVFGIPMMNPFRAAHAVRLIKPKRVMPVHFDVWDNPEKRLSEFISFCADLAPDVEIITPEIGEWIEL